MEIRKEDLKYVEWDESKNAIHFRKKHNLFHFGANFFVSDFQKNLVNRPNGAAFFVYYGLACIYVLGIILISYEKVCSYFSWRTQLIPVLIIGISASMISFSLTRITFAFALFLKKVFTKNNRKKKYHKVPFNDTYTTYKPKMITIKRPKQTPFPEQLKIKS